VEPLKKNLIIIHGAGPKYYRSLPDGTGDWQLKLALRFAKEFKVITPQMPAPTKPVFDEWKFILDKNLAKLKGEVFFVGHSLGASFLVKYLLEEKIKQKVSGLFLVSAPFNTVKGFNFSHDFSTLPPIDHKYLYHCMNDVEVPYAHSVIFQEHLSAKLRTFEGRGHYFKKAEFPEILQDLQESMSETQSIQPRFRDQEN
jgi:predicted alpha/beta hydrolase family esterase